MKLKSKFKTRCHNAYAIMTNPQSKRDRDAGKLSATCLTVVNNWIKQQPEFYGKKPIPVSTSALRKGILMEDESILLAKEVYGWPDALKRGKRDQVNEWIDGECDIELPHSVEDIKNSWSTDTFPLFENTLNNKAYRWQMQAYCALYNKQEAGVVYTLMDAPNEVVERECYKAMRERGMSELEESLFNEIKDQLTFSHYPIDLRVKRFHVKRNNDEIKNLINRVEEIRAYIDRMPERDFWVLNSKELANQSS